LVNSIIRAKYRGALIALSIDGMKKSGSKHLSIPIPPGVFEREVYVSCGRSMLRRFQMSGQTLESEEVSDRLLLTW
jgi:DNA adenine methylase